MHCEEMDSQSEVNHYKHKLVIDVVRDVCGRLERPLREKLRKILADVDMSFYLNLHKEGSGTDHRINNIFGLSPPVLDDLTFSEQKLLQSEVERYILEKYPKQFELYDELISGSNKEKDGGKISQGNSNISEEQMKLLGLSEMYVSRLNESAEQLVRMCDMMGTWIETRLRDTVDRAAVTTQYYQVKNNLLELKAKIIEVQLSLSVYSNNSSGLAYMEINKDITKKMDGLRSDVMSYKRNLYADL